MKRSLTKAAHFVKRLILNGGGAQYAFKYIDEKN